LRLVYRMKAATITSARYSSTKNMDALADSVALLILDLHAPEGQVEYTPLTGGMRLEGDFFCFGRFFDVSDWFVLRKS